jgi:serine/threonine protein kinase
MLALERMSCDLAHLITKYPDPLSTLEVKVLFKRVVQGVSYLHEKWFLHRDLKPDNTFISWKGDVKIGDFGLAR